MVAAIMKISEYVVVIYNFQTGIAKWSILVEETLFYSLINILTLRGSYTTRRVYYLNFTTLDSISTATTITEYCRIAYATNMFI